MSKMDWVFLHRKERISFLEFMGEVIQDRYLNLSSLSTLERYNVINSSCKISLNIKVICPFWDISMVTIDAVESILRHVIRILKDKFGKIPDKLFKKYRSVHVNSLFPHFCIFCSGLMNTQKRLSVNVCILITFRMFPQGKSNQRMFLFLLTARINAFHVGLFQKAHITKKTPGASEKYAQKVQSLHVSSEYS